MTTAPFEVVSIDFLHLKSQRGFEYIVLIVEHYRIGFHRPTQLETRLHERWLKRFTMLLYHDLDFQPVYTAIKKENF